MNEWMMAVPIKEKIMNELPATELTELNLNELEEISGGMRLEPFSPNIHVEDQRYYGYYLGESHGPLSGGYA